MAIYSYEDYLNVRKESLKKNILKKINGMDQERAMRLLEDSLIDFEEAIETKISILYESDGLSIPSYEYHSSIGKVSDSNIRREISDLCTEFDLVSEIFNELTDSYSTERDYSSLDDILNGMDSFHQEYIRDTIRQYELTYLEKIKYLGSGQSATVFSVGDKVFKFGEIRRYGFVPYCLPYHDLHKYDDRNYMYITDKIDISNITYEDAKKVYIGLREKGFVWLDPKPENIGKQNGEYAIIDDIDIITERHILRDGNESVLKFVSNDSAVTQLELDYLSMSDPSFDINRIDKYFNNESDSTKSLIQAIKTEYEKRKRSYEYDPSMSDNELFGSIISTKIAEIKQMGM